MECSRSTTPELNMRSGRVFTQDWEMMSVEMSTWRISMLSPPRGTPDKPLDTALMAIMVGARTHTRTRTVVRQKLRHGHIYEAHARMDIWLSAREFSLEKKLRIRVKAASLPQIIP